MDGLPQFDLSKITIEVSKTVMILAGMSFYAVLNTVGRKKRDVDVLVVGFGSAGGVAALQAYEENPNVSVMVLERFDGGGSSTRSAGIVYAGGGTNAQKALGIDDTKENMFNYLKQEIGTAIDDASLKEFCDTSAENMRWLREDLGVSIDSSENPLLCPYKSSTPPGHYTLMYSGSEGAAPFNTLAKPAPRGHRAMGKGHFAGTGNVLFEGIERAVLKRNDRIEVNRYTKAVALLTDPANPKKIIGCRVQTISHIPFFLRWVFDLSYFIASTTNPYHYYTNAILEPFINLVEFAFGKTYEVSVKKGVILAAGGFQRNYNMVNQYAEPFYGLMPIGGAGEDGSGINMALSLGAKTNMLQKCSAWRFILPPDAFAKGIIVDQQGKRLLNEDVYGARLSEAVMVKAKGNGWLVIDQKLYDEAYEAIHGGKMIVFQQYFTYINLLWNRYSANTIADLERKCGITPGGLVQSLKRYNDDVKSKDEDTEFHKDHKYIAPIETGPFYAINFSKTASSLWPCPFMTLGGLVVDGKTGLVIGTDDKPFIGLYACGRNAAGVPSSSYVSGLSLADCIFSGRRAGRSVAHT